MRILLTGGTGLIGQALCQLWLQQGHELIVYSRRPQQVTRLCGNSVRGVATLDELGDIRLDAVVNLAGAPIADRRWTQKRKAELLDSRVRLTRQLVDWLGRLSQPPATLVSGSATGWYGNGGEQQLQEHGAPASEDFASRLCMAWEHEALRAQVLGMRVILVRTAPVLANGKGFLTKLLPLFRLGLGGRIGNGQQWMPWIHLQDEVAAIDFLLRHPDAEGAYNACAPQAVRNSEFTRCLAEVLHRPALLPVPALALKLLLGELSSMLLGGQHLQPERLLALGFEFRHPSLAEALTDLLG